MAVTDTADDRVDAATTDALELLRESERSLWILAFVLYGIGDTATTFWGLSTAGVVEVGPIAGPAMDSHGRYALIVVKAVVFVGFYGLWRLLRTPGRVAIPLALVAVGGLVTVWNVFVVVSAP